MVRAMAVFLEGLEWTLWGLAANLEESPGRVAESAQAVGQSAESLKEIARNMEDQQ